MKKGDEPQGRTPYPTEDIKSKKLQAKPISTSKMPAMAKPDVKPIKVSPRRRNAILAKATSEEIAANKKKSKNYNYEDATKAAKAVNKRVAAGSGETQVKKKDLEKKMSIKRSQFVKSFNAGTIESRAALGDSIRSSFPAGTPEKEIRKAMPLTGAGRVAYKVKKSLKKGSKAAIAPVAGLVKKVTTAQMNKGCPPKGQ